MQLFLICVPKISLRPLLRLPGLSAQRPPKLQKAKRPRHFVPLHCVQASFCSVSTCTVMKYDIWRYFHLFIEYNSKSYKGKVIKWKKMYFQVAAFQFTCLSKLSLMFATTDSLYRQAKTRQVYAWCTITIYKFISTAFYIHCIFWTPSKNICHSCFA